MLMTILHTLLFFALGLVLFDLSALLAGYLIEKKRQKPYKTLITCVRACAKLVILQAKLKKNIPVSFKTNYDNCNFHSYLGFTFGIRFLLKVLRDDYSLTDEMSMVPTGTWQDRLYFVIAHEAAHAVQYYRHRKWFYRFNKELKKTKTSTNREYSEIKIEQNANKIARVLLNKYRRIQSR